MNTVLTRLCTIILLLVLLSTSTLAANFSYLDLQNVVVKNQITSIDDLLPKLPAEMKSSGIFVYESGGLHASLVSPTSPRVIMFNSDASLLVSFNRRLTASEAAINSDALEVIHFDRSLNTFQTVEIPFNEKDEPFSAGLVQFNSNKCTTCHATNPRPIFQDYNTWPGMFGSFNGRAALGSPEYKFIEQFKSAAASQPRYKELDLSGILFEPDQARVLSRGIGKDSSSSLVVMGQLIEKLMLKRMAHKFYTHSNYTKLAPLISYLGAPNDQLGCGPVRDRYQRIIDDVFKNDSRMAQLEATIAKIRERAQKDGEAKKADFFRNNTSGMTGGDPRGPLSLPSNILILGSDPFYSVNVRSFELQLGLLEHLFDNLGLVTADFSTQNLYKTTGIMHIRIGNLYDDEQYLQGVVQELLVMDPNFKTNFYDKNGCFSKYKDAKASLNSLTIQNQTDGIIY